MPARVDQVSLSSDTALSTAKRKTPAETQAAFNFVRGSSVLPARGGVFHVESGSVVVQPVDFFCVCAQRHVT